MGFGARILSQHSHMVHGVGALWGARGKGVKEAVLCMRGTEDSKGRMKRCSLVLPR